MIKPIELFFIKQNACDDKVLFVGKRRVNVYTIYIDFASTHDKCFSTLHDNSCYSIGEQVIVFIA